jgi:hypothetical protein
MSKRERGPNKPPAFQSYTVVQNIIKQLRGANGETDDATIEARIAQFRRENPETVNWDKIGKSDLAFYHKTTNKLLNKRPGFYMPNIDIKIAKRRNVMMSMSVERHLLSWKTMDHENLKTLAESVARKDVYRDGWIDELRRHRELQTLGDVQRVLHKYVDDPIEDAVAEAVAEAEAEADADETWADDGGPVPT